MSYGTIQNVDSKINRGNIMGTFILTILIMNFHHKLLLATNNTDLEMTTLVTHRDQNLRGKDSVSNVPFRIRSLFLESNPLAGMSAICAVNANGVILKYSMQFSDWPGPVTLTKNTGTNYN